MAYAPIAFTIPNYRDYRNYWLKAYIPGTTTPKAISLDADGTTLADKIELNIDGFPVSAGGTLIIPFIDGAYDLYSFPTEADADSNNTASALRFADSILAAGSDPTGAAVLSVLTQQLNSGQTLVTTQIEATTGQFYVSIGDQSGLSSRLTKDVDYTATNSVTLSLTNSYPQNSYLTEVGSTTFKPQLNANSVTGPIEVIAHRGFADNSFENTILAMSLSKEQGADALEMDASISSDGVWYLFHDGTVDSLTDGTGTFTALTAAYLDTLIYTKSVGTPFAGLGITRLDDALDYIREVGIKAYIEMKGLRNSTTDVDALIQKLADFSVTSQTVVQSGTVARLQRAKLAEPTILAALIVSSGDISGTITNAITANASMVINDFNFFLSNPTMASDFANSGLDSAAYTPDFAYTFKDLSDVGVRKVMSDRSAF